MAMKKDVQSYILEGSIAKMYDCMSFFMNIMISLFFFFFNMREIILGKIYLLFTYLAVVMYLAVRRNSPLSNAQPVMTGVVQRSRPQMNSQRFLCGFGFRLRVSGESGMRVRNFLNRRFRTWKFLNAL